ncbi:hypothetical protein [Haloactinomyces albus]|uniref:Uncharacterized protein n=1 Tax=Haloactinomyces albus TaxID=1352928 RepID=A0AAE3ZAS5_9ACTN|nr:hypothetical protein [Haloactinomyces albus]MDR7300079.1 hypothetical protein [Haloactinomyces albus]
MLSPDSECSGTPEWISADRIDPDSVVRHVRYRAGEVGESQRCVHVVLPTAQGLLASACGQRFAPGRMEDTAGGMPCLACVQRLAAAERGGTARRLVDEHGEGGLPG